MKLNIHSSKTTNNISFSLKSAYKHDTKMLLSYVLFNIFNCSLISILLLCIYSILKVS